MLFLLYGLRSIYIYYEVDCELDKRRMMDETSGIILHRCNKQFAVLLCRRIVVIVFLSGGFTSVHTLLFTFCVVYSLIAYSLHKFFSDVECRYIFFVIKSKYYR